MSGERYILEFLWSIENHKHSDVFFTLMSDILRGNMDLDQVLFYLMCREKSISKLKSGGEVRDASHLYEALHSRTFSRQDCLGLVRDLTMCFEGEETTEYFLTDMKELLGEKGFIKVVEFLVGMSEIFTRLHQEGLTPTLKKLTPSSSVGKLERKY